MQVFLWPNENNIDKKIYISACTTVGKKISLHDV
jgi:hypothetical protein